MKFRAVKILSETGTLVAWIRLATFAMLLNKQYECDHGCTISTIRRYTITLGTRHTQRSTFGCDGNVYAVDYEM